MVIDGHHHIDGDNYQAVVTSMDELGIDKTVLIGVGVSDMSVVTVKDSIVFRLDWLLKLLGPIKGRAVINSQEFKDVILSKPKNDDVLRAMAKCPERFEGFCFINPEQDDVMDEIERCFAGGMIGIKMALLQFPADLSGTNMKLICEYAKAKNAPIFLHQGITKESYDMTQMLKDFPTNYFIIAHAGVQLFQEAINAALKYENVFIDTSSYIVTPAKIKTMHKKLGASKILFGSDVPVMSDNQAIAFDKINNLDISDSDKQRMLGDNLKEILAL